MREAIGCGIDFGSSNSAVSVAFDDGSVELVTVGSGSMPASLRSFIYLHRDGNQQTGEGAIREYLYTGSNRTRCFECDRVGYGRDHGPCQNYVPFGGCNDSRLMDGLKFMLANEYFSRTHSWGRDFSVEDLVAIIVGHLKRAAEKVAGTRLANVVLGKPFGFVGAEAGDFEALQAMAVQRLVDGARLAGFTTIETMYEAEAAGQVELPPVGYTLALDFGGGTFDVAVLSRETAQASVRIVGLQGAPIGGNEFDGLLFDKYVWKQLGIPETRTSVSKKQLRTLSEVQWLISDRRFRHELAVLSHSGVDTNAVDAIVSGGHAYEFYRQIEEAKLRLSDHDEAKIEFHRPGIAVSATVTRAGFEELIEPALNRIDAAVDRALTEACAIGADVSGVMFTGGSSSIPAFRRRMMTKVPSAHHLELPPFTAVAEGLGRKAVALWS